MFSVLWTHDSCLLTGPQFSSSLWRFNHPWGPFQLNRWRFWMNFPLTHVQMFENNHLADVNRQPLLTALLMSWKQLSCPLWPCLVLESGIWNVTVLLALLQGSWCWELSSYLCSSALYGKERGWATLALLLGPTHSSLEDVYSNLTAPPFSSALRTI